MSVKLTRKQRAMIKERLSDKTATNAEVIKRAGYNVSNNHSAAQQYLENMNKPEIAKALDNVAEEMEDTLITVVRRYKDSEELREVQEATTNARWIHDKAKGKATQRVETSATTVNINLDLTGV